MDVVGAEVKASYLITLECWREERKVSKTELGDQASVGCKEGTPIECTFQSTDHHESLVTEATSQSRSSHREP